LNLQLLLHLSKMKFFLLLVAFFAVGAIADDAYFVSEDQAVKLFDEVFESVQADFGGADKFSFLKFFIGTVDRHCMYNKYKEANLFKFISNEYIAEHKGDKKMRQLVWFCVSYYCSSKANAFDEFGFENFMTYHTLYKSFVKEPAFRNYTQYVNFANKYAIDNHYFEDTIYGNKVNFAVESEDNYSEFREFAKIATGGVKLFARKEFHRTCAIGIVSELEKLYFRLFLLLQTNLTFDQKKQEREYYVKVSHELYNQFLVCAAQPYSELNEKLASKFPSV
jgi:hypothetical protein